MRLEDLGVVGNCQFSALVHNGGEIVWCCLPRFDSEPVCSTLLDSENGGRFFVGPASGEIGKQRYIPNTNILETHFQTPTGSFKVIDFRAPIPSVWPRPSVRHSWSESWSRLKVHPAFL